ncbi:hypothetical protein TSH58p_28975 (plasmid) [Azospirillum sp. TSH58]|uniref:hypothetical protein n=1 Tax=Azospirillum sp. TSH58 TaxID=664962 RepID=UPI000D60218E|nr:hypothetical protein [Azospirillum sp. TSH58]AWJ87418.1 hypothetical protein TSH58p_28975 [Azospirillum sp. TSH58]PWC64390.1 hypothetical protein TSH58_22615 [Azospirillum sp. TSH58]
MPSDREPPVELICLPFPEAMALWLLMSDTGEADRSLDLRRLHALSVAFVLLAFGAVALLAWFRAA